MAAKENTIQQAPEPKSHWYSGLGNYAGYVMAGVASVTNAIADVEKHFHKVYFEELVKFQNLKDGKLQAYDDAIRIAKKDYSLLAKKISEIEKDFYKLEKETAKKELKVFNVYDKWKFIKPHQRLEVGLKMATIASLAMGAIFTIRRNQTLNAKVQYHEKTKDEAVQDRAEQQAIADARAGRLPGTEHLAMQVDRHAREQDMAMAQRG